MVGAVFVVLTNLFKIVNPRIVQQAIDQLRSNFQPKQMLFYALLIVGVTLLQGIFLFLMRRTIIVASREIEFDLRNDVFRKLEALPPAFYHQHPTGDLMSRTTNDMNAVRSMLGPGIAYSINTLIAFLLVIPMMVSISPRLTLIALIPFPVLALAVNRFGRAIFKRFERIQAQLARLSSFVQENLSGIAIVKSFVREEQQVNDFLELNKDYLRKNLSYARIHAAFHPSLMVIIGISTILILLFGGKLVIRQSISIGQFTAFMLYMGILVWPAIALGWVIGLFQQGAAAMKRIRVILDSEPEIQDGPVALPKEQFQGAIEFRNLTFGYRADTPVLRGIHLKINPRETVGIIGFTGSGKTTLLRLIPHFFALPSGKLFIDRRDVNEYALHSLREAIGFVPQDTFLFSDTIHNNIAYGNPAATREEVVRAARIAQIHDEIEDFPDGYDSMLGERGINLSGGQKQRVALARAILKEPRIFLLDDAFSALDTYTEEAILNNLKSFFPDRTVLIVSHRVSTLQTADQIICMDNGQIVERGTHHELVNRGGMYASIYQKQLLEKELERLR